MRCVAVLVFNVTFYFLLTAAPSSAQWKGKADNLPIAELQLMTEYELCSDYFGVCLKATSRNPSSKLEGLKYLTTIQRVLRAKGVKPQWISDYAHAIGKDDMDTCLTISNECMRAEVEAEKAEKKEAQ